MKNMGCSVISSLTKSPERQFMGLRDWERTMLGKDQVKEVSKIEIVGALIPLPCPLLGLLLPPTLF